MINFDLFSPQVGNRLFQLAAAIDLADRNLDEVNFPNWPMNKYFEGLYNTEFNGKCNPMWSGTLDEWVRVWQEPSFAFTPIVYQRNLFLKQSYLQSYKYFENSESKIRKMFTVRPEYKHNIRNSLSNYLDSNKTLVSIHVRRGDYAQFPQHHPMITMDYYNKAIQIMQDKYGDCVFLVASDEIDWCRNNFPNSDRFVFLNGDVISDFSASQQCDHFITANSTLSWWWSYLCDNKYKTVIAPKQHFGPALKHHNLKDYWPKEWVLI